MAHQELKMLSNHKSLQIYSGNFLPCSPACDFGPNEVHGGFQEAASFRPLICDDAFMLT